jgi:hypothetical protein
VRLEVEDEAFHPSDGESSPSEYEINTDYDVDIYHVDAKLMHTLKSNGSGLPSPRVDEPVAASPVTPKPKKANISKTVKKAKGEKDGSYKPGKDEGEGEMRVDAMDVDEVEPETPAVEVGKKGKKNRKLPKGERDGVYRPGKDENKEDTDELLEKVELEGKKVVRKKYCPVCWKCVHSFGVS